MTQKDMEILSQISKYWFEKGHLNFDQRDLFIDILKTLKPKSCLEIGFASGRSAVVTLVTVQPEILVSVDKSLDYIPGARAYAELLQQDFPNLKIVEGDSKQVLNRKFFETNFPQGLDFAFIDGDHTYEGCNSDLNAVIPYLNPNGIVLVDDYRSGPPNGVKYPSVDKAIEQFVLKNYLMLERWYKEGKGIAIIKRPSSIAQRFKTLSSLLFRLLFRKARTFLAAVKRGLNLITIDEHSKRFIEHNKRVWAGWKNKKPESVILYYCHSLSQTVIAASYFLNVLARKHNACIKAFSSGRARFLHNIYRNIYHRKVDNIYRSFNTAGFIRVSLSKQQEARKRVITQEVIKNIKTKQDVFAISVLGVWIGIDIYETYLIRYHKPTVVLDDPKLFDLIEEGIGILLFWLDYFERNKVAAVAASHDCYINENILCKIAYQKNIPVYLPNIRGIVFADEPFSVHSYFPYYRQMFNSLPGEEQLNAVSLAKKQLERRLNGEVGVDMPYSTRSAFHQSYSEKPVLRESNKIKVLICTHCFYDNPHAYGGMLFVDFYEWLCYLGKISEKTDYDWYIKMHPDPLPGTEVIIREILEEFPRITFIPPETSHHQLVKEGIDFVLTAYGTVGHEYPALGVQVINAGYNPRIAYDFNWHPKSIEEYEYYLLNLDKLHKEINMQELYEFYYMHHFYVLADDLVLKSYRQFIKDLDPNQQVGPAAYGYFLNQLTEAKHEEIMANIQRFLDSGKRHYFSRGPQ